MNSNSKILILVLFAILFIWINYKYRNIFVRSYNWFSGIPKMMMIFITIIILFAPVLLKNNKFIDYFRDFLPDGINRKLDQINTEKKSIKKEQFGEVQVQKDTRGRKGIGTAKLRKVSDQLKKIVASQQKWHCKGCGNMLDATYEVDHIIALEDGGNNNIENLQALCRNCHGGKTMGDNIKRRYPNGNIG